MTSRSDLAAEMATEAAVADENEAKWDRLERTYLKAAGVAARALNATGLRINDPQTLAAMTATVFIEANRRGLA